MLIYAGAIKTSIGLYLSWDFGGNKFVNYPYVLIWNWGSRDYVDERYRLGDYVHLVNICL